jgi:hypothetical protein
VGGGGGDGGEVVDSGGDGGEVVGGGGDGGGVVGGMHWLDLTFYNLTFVFLFSFFFNTT